MIKKILTKVVLASLLLSSSLMAGLAYDSKPNSLIGFEIGSANMDVSSDDVGYNKTLGAMNYAFKVGSQTDNYRLFLSYRFYDGEDFKSLTTMGAEIQYMVDLASFMNVFIGVNAGVVDIEFLDAGNLTRAVSQQYVGGDVGFNFHIGESFDIELGARIMSIQADHSLDSKTYTFGDIVTGYGSLIYKFQMDK